MKRTHIRQFCIVLVSLVSLAACTTLSPITFTQVNSQQLPAQWAEYQQKALDQITKYDQQEQAAINSINSSIFGQLLMAINDPNNSGIGTALLTSILGALGLGLHVNNLRLDRKIANPEVPMDPSTGSKPAGKASPTPTPTVARPAPAAEKNRANMAFQGSLAASLANVQSD